MDYLAVWKVFEQVIADFRKNGVVVPERVICDLKSARTMIGILKAEGFNEESAQKIEELLGDLEPYLISEGQRVLGAEAADEWLRKLGEARRTAAEEEDEMKLISGLPRGQKWIRVKLSAEYPVEKLKRWAEDLHLSHQVQDDRSIVVYGKDEHIRDFIKKMATRRQSEAGKWRQKVHNR